MKHSRISPPRPTVALLTLGCARNDVDSEELAARLEADGFRLVDDAADADTVVVNTCGFVEAAKKDSVDALLEASELKGSGTTKAVVAVGCMAERYGNELAESLPEADAVLGFDDYPDIADRLRSILAGEQHPAHAPQDRRPLLPISPVERAEGTNGSAPSLPGHAQSAPDLPAGLAPASGPRAVRRRLGSGPMAPLKLASGCDRRCSFCAIPSFRGSFVSRRPTEVLDEARWLAGEGVREVFLVSENSTSYGKDLGDLRLLETLLPELAAVDGVDRVRVSYLQPAETRPSPDRGDRDDAGRGVVLRPVVPARVRPGAAADAALRRRRAVPRTARADPLPRAAGRRPEQLHRRLPGRDRGRRGDAVRLPDGRAPRRGRHLRLLRRGRHRGGRSRRPPRRRRDPGPGRPGQPARRGAHRPACRGPDRRDGRGAARDRRRRDRRGPARLPGARGRRHRPP